MKLKLFMVTTINSIIARDNGEEDFLSHENWKVFCKMLKKDGCLIWGRKTYEMVVKWGQNYINDLAGATIFIVSSKDNLTLKTNNTFIVRSPKEAIKKIKESGFKNAILSGGGKINSSFIKERLVDEIIINISPYLLGKGIKLFSEDNFETNLKLIKVKKLKKDIVQIYYKVKNA